MSSPEQTLHTEKYKDVGLLGTGLHVIESNSNEVSGSADCSQQIASLDDVVADQLTFSAATHEQDYILDELQRKNNKTLKMIKLEKN